VADPAALPAPATDGVDLHARLRELESALATLTTDLAQVKMMLASPPQRLLLLPGGKKTAGGEDRR
jgi:hypothetical protein